MKCNLNRKDIISLLKGVVPNYSVMDKIPERLGSYVGGFVDNGRLNYIPEDVPYTEE